MPSGSWRVQQRTDTEELTKNNELPNTTSFLPWGPAESLVVNISKLTNRWNKRNRSIIFVYIPGEIRWCGITSNVSAMPSWEGFREFRRVPVASAIILMTYFPLPSKDIMWVKTKRNTLSVMSRGCSSSVFTFLPRFSWLFLLHVQQKGGNSSLHPSTSISTCTISH